MSGKKPGKHEKKEVVKKEVEDHNSSPKSMPKKEEPTSPPPVLRPAVPPSPAVATPLQLKPYARTPLQPLVLQYQQTLITRPRGWNFKLTNQLGDQIQMLIADHGRKEEVIQRIVEMFDRREHEWIEYSTKLQTLIEGDRFAAAESLNRLVGQLESLRLDAMRSSLSFVPEQPAYITCVLRNAPVVTKEEFSIRVNHYGMLRPEYVRSDGNCLFDALADQLYKDEDPEWHDEKHRHETAADIRKRTTDYRIKFMPDQGFDNKENPVPDKDFYKDGCWGDEAAIWAAAQVFDCEIIVIRNTVEHHLLAYRSKSPQKTLYIVNWNLQHFGSLQVEKNKPAPGK